MVNRPPTGKALSTKERLSRFETRFQVLLSFVFFVNGSCTLAK